jgi:KaiC/GvpD/RAD55 family RecA-like ATPase
MNQQISKDKNLLTTLNSSISGGLGSGDLGVVMARAGVGKTALLVYFGLDALISGKKVLHVALAQNTDHVLSWYDTLFKNISGNFDSEKISDIQAEMPRRRLIQTFSDKDLNPQRLEKAVTLFAETIDFKPDLILIDGFNWEKMSKVETAAAIGAFKSTAQRLNAELWMSAATHRSTTKGHPTKIVPPCDAYKKVINTAIFLEPQGRDIGVFVLKDHETEGSFDTHIVLDCDSLSLASDSRDSSVKLPPASFTLLSGGAKGSEEAFGICAEKWGAKEKNYSFEGHDPARTRGIVLLSAAELEQGHVSNTYVNSRMHRTYPKTPLFQKVLQSLWHQVNTSGEIFAVGTIMPDNTVKGGTGWAAELARHWGKPVHVYDQEKDQWLFWQDDQWKEEEPPVIKNTRFTGTGTRFPTENALKAINNLFERSFGPAK